ncbi:MAG: hypothetical protein JJU02_00800, partial [Cryomorphaceae bacterium]|nr:hypothetical protein [Cryomorphaceae bacterium]
GDNSNSARGLLNVPMAGGQSNNVPVVAGLPDPMNFDYKNREVITNSEDGKDYILFDNMWHEISKEEFVTFTFFDGTHTEVKIHRVAFFEADYVFRQQFSSGVYNASGFGTASSWVSWVSLESRKEMFERIFKTSKYFGAINFPVMIAAFSEASWKELHQVYFRMELYDAGVEAKRNR